MSRTVLWFMLALAVAELPGMPSAESAGRLKITPARTEVTIASGEPAPTGSYKVKNTSGQTVSVTVQDNVSWLSLTPTSFTLSSGATQTVTYSTSAFSSSGTYTAKILFIIAGGTNSPTSQILVKVIYKVVGSKTDLVVDNLTASPSATVACGTPFTVTASIRNAGAKPSGPFRITWFQNGSVFYRGTHPSLAGGAVSKDYTRVLNFKKGKSRGTYIFQVALDANNAVAESNDSNNSYSKTIGVSCP